MSRYEEVLPIYLVAKEFQMRPSSILKGSWEDLQLDLAVLTTYQRGPARPLGAGLRALMSAKPEVVVSAPSRPRGIQALIADAPYLVVRPRTPLVA